MQPNRRTGSKSRIEFKALPDDDPKVRQPDIARARSVLGWEPQTDRAGGLKETIAYFRTALANRLP